MKHLEIAVGLLLLVQAFQLAAPQTTRSVLTMDPSWLRSLTKRIQGDVVGEEQDNGNYITSGTSSGAMEEENMAAPRSQTEPVRFVNVTESPADAVKPTESPSGGKTDIPPAAEVTVSKTGTGNDVNATLIPQNDTSFPHSSNSSNATSAPDLNPVPTPDGIAMDNAGLNNSTPAANDTGVKPNGTGTEPNGTGAEPNEATTQSPSVFVNPESTARTPAMTAAIDNAVQSTGDTGGRGSVLDFQNSARQQAWGAVLATAVVVAVVGLVAYIILKKKYPKGFSHRKLVEEYPSDPVLRLDNSDPLDLNYGPLGYHNPGLRADDIQMSRIPGRP